MTSVNTDHPVHDDIISMLSAWSTPDGSILGTLLDPQREQILADLPRLTERDLESLNDKDATCSICFTPYLSILAEEETALAMDSPAHPVEELGLTKLSQTWQCGHLFCRRDITKWIRSGNASCPLCRRPLAPQSEPTSQDPEQRLQSPQALHQFLDSLRNEFRTLAEERISEGQTPREERSQFLGMYS